MIIDMELAQKAFDNYVKDYDPEDKKVALKIAHIKRVSNLSKEIATNLNMREENIELAELIGLLHDIGRFEQIRQYHTFVDKDSINHGELGVQILFGKNGIIRDFIQTDIYDDTIKNAILNHNTAKISDNLSEFDKIHSKIIRDADKLDIFYILTIGDKKAIWEKNDLSNDKISDEVYREFIEDKSIQYKNRNTSADILVSHFAYVYDFYFRESLEKLCKSGYVDKLYGRFLFEDRDTQERYEDVYRRTKKFVEKHIF